MSSSNGSTQAGQRLPPSKEPVGATSGRPAAFLTAGNPLPKGGDEVMAVEPGTIGCFAKYKDASKAAKTVVLSAHHVFYMDPGDTGSGAAIGSPTVKSTWPCRTGMIGQVVGGIYSDEVDCAIAELEPGRPFLQVIPGLGKDRNNQNKDQIRGIAKRVNYTDPDTHETFNVPVIPGQTVRKVGATTHATIGTVAGVNFKASPDGDLPSQVHLISVYPTEDEMNKGSDGRFHFTNGGDSGAIVVDEDNLIVGLLVRRFDARAVVKGPKPGPRAGMCGAFTDIYKVLAALDAIGQGIEILPSPDATGFQGPTRLLLPGSGIRTAPRLTGEDLVRQSVLERIKEELRRFPLGAAFVRAMELNQPEIVRLVHHHRRVKVVWYRAHGPEIVAVAGSGLRDLDQPIPHEVAGTSIEQVIDSIQAALQTHGSPELAEDVGRFAPPLKAALAGSPTIRAFIDNLRAADSHA